MALFVVGILSSTIAALAGWLAPFALLGLALERLLSAARPEQRPGLALTAALVAAFLQLALIVATMRLSSKPAGRGRHSRGGRPR